MLYAGLALLISVRPEKGQEYYHLSLAALAALVLAGIYLAWSRSALSNGWAGGLLILLMLVELGNVSTAGYLPLARPLFLNKLYQHQDIARYLQTRAEPVRVAVDSEDIPYNFGDWFGVDQAIAYQPGALKGIIGALQDPGMQRQLAVNYRIGHAPSGNFQTEVFTGSSGLKVYRDDGALPRVRADRVLGQTFSPNQVRVDVEMAAPGTVIVADAWYPGWKAEVDGQSVPIQRAEGLIRGVAVGKGRHQVRMTYQPLTLYAGATLALLGLLICGGLSFVEWPGGSHSQL